MRTDRRRLGGWFLGSLLGLIALPALGQQSADFIGLHGGLDTLYVADYDAETYVGPPVSALRKGAVRTANIEVTYNGFSPQAQQAFQFAVDLWEQFISSPVTIRIRANWAALDEDVLGAAGPTTVFAGDPSFLLQETWYAAALAKALTREDLTREGATLNPDIVATFNADFDNWYFGTDGNTPRGEFDLVTVVLHEIGHGLGFTGSFDYDDGVEGNDERDECPGVGAGFGCWGIASGTINYPLTYDRFTEDNDDVSLLDESIYPNPSVELGAVLLSETVFFDGPATRLAYGDARVDLYAPSNFEPGSSFSHLDESAFPAGTPNSLMTPQLARAEAIFSPGPVTCAIFLDIGWTLGPGCEDLLGISADARITSFEAALQGDDVTLLWNVSAASADGREIERLRLERKDVDCRLRVDYDGGACSFEVVEAFSQVEDVQQYEVENLPPGRYEFQLVAERRGGVEDTPLAPEYPGDRSNVLVRLEAEAAVTDVFPNPFQNRATVLVQVRTRQRVRVEVYNSLGQLVAEPFDGVLDTNGGVRASIQAEGLPAGVYFVRARGDSFNQVSQAVIVR